MEDVLVSLVDRLTHRSWKKADDSTPISLAAAFKIPAFMTQKYRGMTLLHLASSLGYTKLVCSLLHWSARENPVLTLQTEIDALAQDHEGFTPLMRSCLYGKRETALFLYRWNPTVIKVRNYDGESCLDLAAPHEALFAELESLEKERAKRLAAAESSKDRAKKDQFVKPNSRAIR